MAKMVFDRKVLKGKYAGCDCRVVKVNPLTLRIEVLFEGKKIKVSVSSEYVSKNKNYGN
jgi:hypothetical protein